MKEKRKRSCDVTISAILLPEDANPSGNIHGGVIMKHIDNAAGVVAHRYARANVVTASIDRLDFHNPGFVGNLLTLMAKLNWVGKTSMEIGVRAETENLITGEVRHIASAYLTFVALDENSRPKTIPKLVCESRDEQRRFREAEKRRAVRLAEKTREKECQTNFESCD